MPFKLRKQHVLAAKEQTPWHFSNQVLYDLCRGNPTHVDREVILAKILMIGRVYAAAIERRREKTGEKGNFYLSTVWPALRRSEIDNWLEVARRVKPGTAQAVAGMRKLADVSASAERGWEVGDSQYRQFATRCDTVQRHCKAQFRVELRPRQLDNLLLKIWEG